MTDFSRQVLLSVVDKVLLGGAALGVGYLVNLRLERFRARRALEGEFLRERTRRLDELYVPMLEVEAAAREYTRLERRRIEKDKGWPRDMNTPETPHSEHAFEAFREVSLSLMRKAAHYRPWIGDSLQVHCAGYADVVLDRVTQQTVAGSHDIDRISKLQDRTSALQAEIMAAIREGAPPALLAGTGGEPA